MYHMRRLFLLFTLLFLSLHSSLVSQIVQRPNTGKVFADDVQIPILISKNYSSELSRVLNFNMNELMKDEVNDGLLYITVNKKQLESLKNITDDYEILRYAVLDPSSEQKEVNNGYQILGANPFFSAPTYSGDPNKWETLTIYFEGKNIGDASSEGGYMTLSLPDFSDFIDYGAMFLDGMDWLAKYAKGQSIFSCSGNTITAKYAMLDGFEQTWSGNETHKIWVKVTPYQAGDLSIHAKMSIGSIHYPSGGCNSTDQQGFPVLSYNISIPAKAKPDLIVSDIKISPTSPIAGQSATITATLKNQGNANAARFYLKYYVDDVYQGEDDLTLGLGQGNSNDESISVIVSTSGPHVVKVVVDPDNYIDESLENNNSRQETFTWGSPPKPDLIVSDIKISPTSPSAGQSTTITATLKNQGNASAGRFYLKYYVDGVYQGEDDLTFGLSAGSSNDEDISVTVNTSGPHTVKVIVDPDNYIAESDDNNNIREEIYTWQTAPKPDLIVSDINVSPTSPTAGESVTITTTLKNIGNVSAPKFYLKYYVDDVYQGEDDLTFGLSAGSSNNEDISVTVNTSGPHVVKVVVDPDNYIDESLENNNSRQETFTWGSPPITKSILTLKWVNSSGQEISISDDEETVYLKIATSGYINGEQVNVEIYEADPNYINPDDYITTKTITVNNNSGQTSWLAVWQDDGLGGLPEYCFKIGSQKSSLLEVKNGGPFIGTGMALDGQTKTLNIYKYNGQFRLIDVTKPMFTGNMSLSNPQGVIATYNAGLNNNNSPSSDNLISDPNSDKNFEDKASVSVHNFISVVFDYYKNNHKRNSWDNKGGTIKSVVHTILDDQTKEWGFPNNAAWMTSGNYMLYGDGDNIIFKNLAGSLDVTAHEITHGVTQSSAELFYHKESGALNESYSDVFACFIDDRNWLIGEDVTIQVAALRSLQDPTQYNQPADFKDYKDLPDDKEHDWGGVHINSGIPNKAAYLIASAIGIAKTSKIYYQTLTTKLTSYSDFVDAANLSVESAGELYGINSFEYNAVKSGFQQVGILSPDNPNNDVIIISSGPSGNPNPVASSGQVNCTVSATDSRGDNLSYSWSSTSGGTFNNSNVQNPVWTAPANNTGQEQSYTLSVTVTCSNGKTATSSYQQRVSPSSDVVTITSSPSGNPNPVASSGQVNCTVSATDSRGDNLSYSWSSTSGGTFNNSNVQNPVWTAPANNTGQEQSYTLSVTVTCSNGKTATSSYQQRITSINCDPTWTPVSYTNSTTAYGIVTINGAPAASGDKVSAFVGSECRGVGTVIINQGNAYVNFNIQGEKVEIVGFKIFHLSECKIYEVGYTINTNPGNSIGYPPNYLPIASSTSVTQNINLTTGWNYLSFYVHPQDMKPSNVFGSILNSLSQVKNLSQSYDPTVPDFLNTLTSLRDGYGYLVKLKNSATLSISGSLVGSLSIPLATGWNLIGHPKQNALPVTTVFSSIMSDIVQIKSVDKSYDPSVPDFLNTLSQMEPGQGYFIKMKNSSIINYSLAAQINTAEINSNDFAKGGNRVVAYTNSTTVYGELYYNGIEEIKTVKAMVNGECRAIGNVVKVESKYYVTLVVNGETEEPMEFSLYAAENKILGKSVDKLITKPGEILYHKILFRDGNEDNVKKNDELTVNKLYPVYPNPFNPTTIITFELVESSPVDLTIYNINGQIVKRMLSQNLSAGHYTYQWDGKNDDGGKCSSGIYFLRMITKRTANSQKLLLIK